jgi:hypothetical protein
MTVTLSRATLATALEEVARTYFSNRRTISAPTKKAEELDAAFRRGLAEATADFLFLHRCNSLPRFKSLPPIYESDVRGILDPAASDFINGLPEEKGQVLDGIVDALLALAVPADLIETDESERKKAVLAGEERAKPEDAVWIGELADAKRREVEELLGLLQPIGMQKANDATTKPPPRNEPQCAGMCGKRLSAFDTKEDYANHLIHDHAHSPSEAKRFTIAGWSRLTTYQQYKERADHPLVTASGSGIISTSPTLGDAMSQVIGAVRGGGVTQVEGLVTSGERPVTTAASGPRTPGLMRIDTTVYDGECIRCQNSGVGACDDAPHPQRGEQSVIDTIVPYLRSPGGKMGYGIQPADPPSPL